MDVTGSNLGKKNYGPSSSTPPMKNNRLRNATNEFLKDGKKVADEIYEHGRQTVVHAQDSIRSYSNEMTKQMQARPISTLLIAAGIGFILASFFRRR